MTKKSGNTTPKVGRPSVPVGEKVRRDGLFPRQWEALSAIAKARGLPVAYVLREAVDWYLTAKEQARSGSVASPEQDREYEQLTKSGKSNHKEK